LVDGSGTIKWTRFGILLRFNGPNGRQLQLLGYAGFLLKLLQRLLLLADEHPFNNHEL